MDTSTLYSYGFGVAAAGLAVFVALPYLSGDIKAEKRKEALQAPRAKRGLERIDSVTRRKQVSDSLKELEQRGKSKRVTLEIKIAQAGLGWTRMTYILVSVALGAMFGLGVYAINGSPLIAGAAVLVGGFGLPSWFLSFRKKRRLASFVNEFPNAVDIVIRGVKAGLPLGDCLRIIATESPEPLKSEFRQVVEAQAVGLTVTEAVERMAERVPVTESHFFAIVIGIQQKSGGNLTEALGNLSRVIRDRKKMRGKIKAVSSEAKASAGIIGALPFVVGSMVYLTSPDYMSLLFTTNTGRFIMLGCACWMGIGIFVMKKMIAFDI